MKYQPDYDDYDEYDHHGEDTDCFGNNYSDADPGL